MSRNATYQNLIKELEDMFPNHSTNIIQSVLNECRGNIDMAVTRILQIPPDKAASKKHHRTPRPNTQRPPSQASSTQSSLIFGEDFLRWPNDMKFIKVFRDEGVGSLLDDQSPPIPAGDGLDLLSLSSNTVETETLSEAEFRKRSQNNKNGWDSIRSKLSSQ